MNERMNELTVSAFRTRFEPELPSLQVKRFNQKESMPLAPLFTCSHFSNSVTRWTPFMRLINPWKFVTVTHLYKELYPPYIRNRETSDLGGVIEQSMSEK